MWEVDIEGEFARMERRAREAEEAERVEAAQGLGFGRLAELDAMDVDLTDRLVKKKPPAGAATNAASTAGAADGVLETVAKDAEEEEEEEEEEAEYTVVFGRRVKVAGAKKAKKLVAGDANDGRSAIDLATTDKNASKYDLDGWNYAPTRAEQSRWQREWEKGEAIRAAKNPVYAKSKFSTKQLKKLRPKDLKPTVPGRELTAAEKAERQRAIDESYVKVKQNLLLTTAGLCGSGTVAAFFVGGTNLGASFAFGSAGALFYVKLLASKAEAEGGGQGGPPSILVPVILFMALNRWNTFFAEDVGLTLAPVPMLLGFFTYKPASIFQAFRDVLEEEQKSEGEEYALDGED